MGNQSVLLCLSAAGRLSALERVRSERFHCIGKMVTEKVSFVEWLIFKDP